MDNRIIFNDEIVTVKQKTARPVTSLKVLGYLSGGSVKTSQQANLILIGFIFILLFVYVFSMIMLKDVDVAETDFYQEHAADHHPQP